MSNSHQVGFYFDFIMASEKKSFKPFVMFDLRKNGFYIMTPLFPELYTAFCIEKLMDFVPEF